MFGLSKSSLNGLPSACPGKALSSFGLSSWKEGFLDSSPFWLPSLFSISGKVRLHLNRVYLLRLDLARIWNEHSEGSVMLFSQFAWKVGLIRCWPLALGLWAETPCCPKDTDSLSVTRRPGPNLPMTSNSAISFATALQPPALSSFKIFSLPQKETLFPLAVFFHSLSL